MKRFLLFILLITLLFNPCFIYANEHISNWIKYPALGLSTILTVGGVVCFVKSKDMSGAYGGLFVTGFGVFYTMKILEW
jgi:hypothetical protein